MITLYEMDKVCFHLIGMNAFYVKADNERLAAAYLLLICGISVVVVSF